MTKFRGSPLSPVLVALGALAHPAGAAAGDDLASASRTLVTTNAVPWLDGASSLSIGVRAGVQSTPNERERIFGVIELGIPLDRWALPAALAAPSDADTSERGPSAPTLLATDLEQRRFRPSLAERAEPGAGFRLTPAFARAAVAEALRQLGTQTALAELDSMATRSRASASLPEVRLGAGTSQDESLRLTPTVNDPARFTQDGGRDLWLEARLTWHLDRAIFNGDEIAIARLEAQQREDRARLTREVLDALLDWQRARLALADGSLLPEERLAAEMAELGATLRLDVATGGWFSRQVARKGADRPENAMKRPESKTPAPALAAGAARH
jgi:hypothetical protein